MNRGFIAYLFFWLLALIVMASDEFASYLGLSSPGRLFLAMFLLGIGFVFNRWALAKAVEAARHAIRAIAEVFGKKEP